MLFMYINCIILNKITQKYSRVVCLFKKCNDCGREIRFALFGFCASKIICITGNE